MDKEQIMRWTRQLCEAPGISGREGQGEKSAAQIARGLLSALGPVKESPLGSLLCTVQEGETDAPHLMLEAHLDQVGMTVTHLEEGGFLRVSNVGGLDNRLLPAMAVVIHTAGGPRPAVVASTPPHLIDGEEKPQKISDLLVDTGYSTEEAREFFRSGDPVTMDNRFIPMGEDLMLSAAQDDRVGCVAVIAAAHLIKEQKPGCKVSVVLASLEEVGGQGAATAAYALAPDRAIAVDVSFADGFGVPKHRCGTLGGGPMIGHAPGLDSAMTRRLQELCGEEDIPCQDEVMGGRTSTDADSIFAVGTGVRTALVSIPLRNMHTAVEVVKARDVLDTARLLAAYAKEVR